MAGLVLKLGPRERVLINGAVLENGTRRSRFSIVTPSANVLRLKDAIHPDSARTPMSRICYQLQLVLAGSSEPELAVGQIEAQLRELVKILPDPLFQEQLLRACQAVVSGKFYQALKALKPLLPVEEKLLSRPLARS